MSENWHEERERLRALLHSYETGKLTHFNEDEHGQLRRETTAERIESVKRRLAALEERLGNGPQQ